MNFNLIKNWKFSEKKITYKLNLFFFHDIFYLGLLFASASFGIIMFSKDESLVGCCLILISFSVMIGNSYCFMIINEYFSGEVAKLGVIMITMICGIYGIIFVAYAYFINGYWLGLFAAMTIMMPINSIYLLLFTGGVDVKEALSKMVYKNKQKLNK